MIDEFSSKFALVTGAIPQNLILGIVVFTIYINDIDTGLNNCKSKFPDNTNNSNSFFTDDDRQSFLKDLD